MWLDSLKGNIKKKIKMWILSMFSHSSFKKAKKKKRLPRFTSRNIKWIESERFSTKNAIIYENAHLARFVHIKGLMA